MNVTLSGLERGQWRHLEKQELEKLLSMLN